MTTSKEASLINEKRSKSIILAYSDDKDFDSYIIRILAAVKIGYKEQYSEILFSLDPGKRTGLMIFLDGYYLYSHCCFKPSQVIDKIIKYIQCFQTEKKSDLKVNFKLGNGVLAITLSLVKEIYLIYNNRENLRVFIVDEFKSSKIKINQKSKPYRVSKDELSALVLALRNGIEINQENYLTLIKQSYKNRKKISDTEGAKNEDFSYDKSAVGEIVLKVIDGELTLSSASKELKLLNRLK